MNNHENETMISNWTDAEIAEFDVWARRRFLLDAFEGTVDPWADSVDLNPPF